MRKMVKFFLVLSLAITVAVGLVVACVLIKHNRQLEPDMSPDDDEVGLSALRNYAEYKDLDVEDFQQPRIWAQLSQQAKADPRGPCIIIEYQTKPKITPRHVLLLYVTPRNGIIDEEVMVD